MPCYNEAKNIPLIIERFSNSINRDDIEVIFVDNGSTDDSKSVFKDYLPKHSFAKLVNLKINNGYGHGIKCGLLAAKGDFIGYTHADMQTDPKDVIKALEIIESKGSSRNLFVKGLRKGRPFIDEFFTKGMSIFETLYLGTSLWDINAQPNIFHKTFFEKIKSKCPNDFSFDLYILYKSKKLNIDIVRFDVIFPERKFGVSSWNTGIVSKWNFIKRTLEFSSKLKKDL